MNSKDEFDQMIKKYSDEINKYKKLSKNNPEVAVTTPMPNMPGKNMDLPQFDIPVPFNVPSQEETPSQEEMPMQEEKPMQENMPSQEEKPSQEKMPMQEKAPMQENTGIEPEINRRYFPLVDKQNDISLLNNMELENSIVASIPKDKIPKGVTEGLDGEGFLQVRVFTARGAVPVKGVTVSVSLSDGQGERLVYNLRTDNDGATPVLPLPTVSRKLSQQPGIKNPFAAYNIRISHPGYFSVEHLDVPIFDKQTAMQPIELVPLPKRKSTTKTPG